jgi:phosphopantetheinyl transferase (holo-ACP synthase)
MTHYPTIESFIGNTPLVRLQRLSLSDDHEHASAYVILMEAI